MRPAQKPLVSPYSHPLPEVAPGNSSFVFVSERGWVSTAVASTCPAPKHLAQEKRLAHDVGAGAVPRAACSQVPLDSSWEFVRDFVARDQWLIQCRFADVGIARPRAPSSLV